MMAYGIREMDTMFRVGCSVPGCCTPQDPTRDRAYVHARCHLEWPLWAYYVRGVLVLECSRCEKKIIAIRPAVEGQEVDLSGL